MTAVGREYPCVSCEIANCTHKTSNKTRVREAPNGIDIHGKPIHVTNCDISPRRVTASVGVFDCDDFKPMNAA